MVDKIYLIFTKEIYMKKLLIAAACAMLAVSSHADEKSVREGITKLLPDYKFTEVTYLKDVKLYELVMQKEGQEAVAHTNEELDFMILPTGEIIDLKKKVNITVEREIFKTKEKFNALPFKEAFSVKYGNGSRKIAVFSDPDCPFCQQMEKGLLSMKEDVTIYYFMNPLKSLHPEAASRAARILCDKDPAKAWVRYTTNGPGLSQDRNVRAAWNPEAFLPKNNGSCAKASLVEKQYNLASSWNFNSTPSVIFDNGYIIRNVVTPEQIKAVLSKRK